MGEKSRILQIFLTLNSQTCTVESIRNVLGGLYAMEDIWQSTYEPFMVTIKTHELMVNALSNRFLSAINYWTGNMRDNCQDEKCGANGVDELQEHCVHQDREE